MGVLPVEPPLVCEDDENVLFHDDLSLKQTVCDQFYIVLKGWFIVNLLSGGPLPWFS